MFDVTTQQSDVEEDDLVGGHWDGWYTPDNAGAQFNYSFENFLQGIRCYMLNIIKISF